MSYNTNFQTKKTRSKAGLITDIGQDLIISYNQNVLSSHLCSPTH